MFKIIIPVMKMRILGTKRNTAQKVISSLLSIERWAQPYWVKAEVASGASLG